MHSKLRMLSVFPLTRAPDAAISQRNAHQRGAAVAGCSSSSCRGLLLICYGNFRSQLLDWCWLVDARFHQSSTPRVRISPRLAPGRFSVRSRARLYHWWHSPSLQRTLVRPAWPFFQRRAVLARLWRHADPSEHLWSSSVFRTHFNGGSKGLARRNIWRAFRRTTLSDSFSTIRGLLT